MGIDTVLDKRKLFPYKTNNTGQLEPCDIILGKAGVKLPVEEHHLCVPQDRTLSVLLWCCTACLSYCSAGLSASCTGLPLLSPMHEIKLPCGLLPGLPFQPCVSGTKSWLGVCLILLHLCGPAIARRPSHAMLRSILADGVADSRHLKFCKATYLAT